jgi:hypothetical protein
MENKMIFIAEEKSFIIEADGKKLRVSYDEFSGNHDDAMRFCKEQGGGDETVENLRFIARHRDAINEELKKIGKEIITGWYWTNEIAWWSADCAFVVSTDCGYVGSGTRYYSYAARAVSAL